MQEEPKPTPKPKKTKISKRVSLIIFGVILVVVAIGVILYLTVIKDNRPVVDCQKIIADSKKLYAEKKYKESYELIKPSLEKCVNDVGSDNSVRVINSTTDKATKTDTYSKSAISAYKAGDIQNAKMFAEKAINQSLSMTPEERSRVPNGNKEIMDAFMIKNGIYSQ